MAVKSESSPIKAPNLFQARLGEEGPDKFMTVKPSIGSIWLHSIRAQVAGLALCWTLWLLGSTVAQDTKGSAETLMNLMILKELKMAVSCCVLDGLNDRAAAVC